jgi:DNA-binding GntR family transcriptional regulator
MQGVTKTVEDHYRGLIDQLPPGARLPSERSVMRDLDSCRSTIRIVLTKLVAEKLLYPVHGKGYFKL